MPKYLPSVNGREGRIAHRLSAKRQKHGSFPSSSIKHCLSVYFIKNQGTLKNLKTEQLLTCYFMSQKNSNETLSGATVTFKSFKSLLQLKVTINIFLNS
jgi:hypothetical protein